MNKLNFNFNMISMLLDYDVFNHFGAYRLIKYIYVLKDKNEIM